MYGVCNDNGKWLGVKGNDNGDDETYDGTCDCNSNGDGNGNHDGNGNGNACHTLYHMFLN